MVRLLSRTIVVSVGGSANWQVVLQTVALLLPRACSLNQLKEKLFRLKPEPIIWSRSIISGHRSKPTPCGVPTLFSNRFFF